MHGRLSWERDGRDWPHRDASRFVPAAGLMWHVQQMGQGPAIWLLHGTGASTHSWRDLLPRLAERHTAIAIDLPGHGFTSPATAEQLSLPGMARAIAALVGVIGIAPRLIVGHSAGAAIAARMCLDQLVAPHALVSINGALLPLGGLAGQFFLPAARLMAATSLVPRLFAWQASDPRVVQRLVEGTGSTLDARGLALYGRLVRSPAHAAGALGMMANWDLQPLQRDLLRLPTRLHLVVGSNDRTVSPHQAQRVQALLPAAKLTQLPGLGHLAHEERPGAVVDLVLADV